ASAGELMTLASDRSLLNRDFPRYRRLACRLYDTLFKGLAIPTKRVIISPDDYFIPFELLLTDSTTHTTFLLRKHAFSYAWSAGSLLKGMEGQGPVNSRLLGIAPTVYQPYLRQPPLEGADHSLTTLSAYFSSSNLLVKEEATKQQFLSSLPDYPV